MIDLRLGDCTQILKQIPSNSIDCIITDPPCDVSISGGGTTGLVCKNNDRNFIGIEINEQYFTVAQKRIGESSAISLKNKSGKKGLLC